MLQNKYNVHSLVDLSSLKQQRIITEEQIKQILGNVDPKTGLVNIGDYTLKPDIVEGQEVIVAIKGIIMGGG